MSNIPLPPLSLYIHIPWCVRKCPYCDFHSYEIHGTLPERAYLAALLADLAQDVLKISNRSINTIFIGGGTPSLLSPETIEQLLNAIRARIPVVANAEITLEANPGTVDNARFKGFHQAGITRLSIGIQSFQNSALQKLGRIHGQYEALRAIEAARGAGFTNFNIDLMFGLPGQTVETSLDDLQTVVILQPAHLSWYQLTLEPHTHFYQHPPLLPDEDTVWTIYTMGQTFLAEHGYKHYEISAYARDHQYCRHNLNYWQFGDYLGIGAGAHSKISTISENGLIIRRFSKKSHPIDYLATAHTPAVIENTNILNTDDICIEFMMNALRLPSGFTCEQLIATTGLTIESIAKPLEKAYRQGFLVQEGQFIHATALGLRFLNDLLELF